MRIWGLTIFILLSGAAALLAVLVARLQAPAPLDLGEAPGWSMASRLAAVEGAACRAALSDAGVRFTALPPRRDGAACGYDDGIRYAVGGSRTLALRPAGPVLACPVAAGLAVWEWQVVQPAALRWFGVPVTGIDHFGSYACRRIAGAASAGWSEHASARAIDVAGFRLADGRRITVARDWQREGTPAAGFLAAVRDGACDIFATTLSPDYNAAHADHLHLDMAARGAQGWRACR